MTPDRIEKLKLEDYPHFRLSSGSELYRYSIDKVIEERCDELDYILEEEGFEILDRNMIRVATSIYNYEVIVSK
jgi:hypothetical protein